MKKKYINPTAQAIQLEINPLLLDTTVQNPTEGPGSNVGGGKEHIISNDEPEYDEEL